MVGCLAAQTQTVHKIRLKRKDFLDLLRFGRNIVLDLLAQPSTLETAMGSDFFTSAPIPSLLSVAHEKDDENHVDQALGQRSVLIKICCLLV